MRAAADDPPPAHDSNPAGRCPRFSLLWVAAALLATTAAKLPPRPTSPLDEAAMLHCIAWVAPAYPTEAIARKLEGRVRLRFIIDEKGAVTKARVLKSSDPLFEQPALAAAQQWRFEPVTENGRSVPKCVEGEVPFELADLKPRSELSRLEARVVNDLVYPPTTPPVKTYAPDPAYPDSLLPRKLPGHVLVDFRLDSDGRVTATRVLAGTHPEFISRALATVRSWTFRPARQGDLAVAGSLQAKLDFDYVRAEGETVDLLASNELFLVQKEGVATPEVPPSPLILVDPAFPAPLLQAGTEGEAAIEFVIGATGGVERVIVVEATDPAFGRALAAAAEACWFQAAETNGQGVSAVATWRHKFSPTAAIRSGQTFAQFAEWVRNSDPAALGARGLDRPLTPCFQVPPVYPLALRAESVKGAATIEFVVDRDGRCRLARIVSATREEFGWAAATAVERWVFDPPTRRGAPTAVRVSIPFQFEPPG